MSFTTQTINNNKISLSISLEQIIDAVKTLDKEGQEDFIEDLLAAISPEYLESIREARQDYKEVRVYSHVEVFQMNQILNDKDLIARMKQGSEDAKNKRGRFAG